MKSTHFGKTLQSSLKTLIVDDNSTNLRILERTLRHHFSHLISCDDLVKASDGPQALEAYHNQSFDLILLDIDMPTMSGVDVARSIRQIDPDIIIIACTTSDSSSARELYAEVGMDGCVAKPLDLREVAEALLQSLLSRTHLDLYRQGRVIGKSPSKFRSHHGSLPAIALEPCALVPTMPTVLSDSGLQDIHIMTSCYFQGLTQDELQAVKHMPATEDHDIDSLNGSESSSSTSHPLSRMMQRSESSISHNHICKRPRRESTCSDQPTSRLDLFEFPSSAMTIQA